VYFAEEFVVTGDAVAKSLALRVHVPAGEDVLFLVVALPKLLFLVLSVAACHELFSSSLFFCPVAPA
jgi:hypothetical protein